MSSSRKKGRMHARGRSRDIHTRGYDFICAHDLIRESEFVSARARAHYALAMIFVQRSLVCMSIDSKVHESSFSF